uniref:Uncharacterized protein n=1 Tax=Equus asinus asinus TaxID=83772 RepID=A0A8C4MJ92_EQUAS
ISCIYHEEGSSVLCFYTHGISFYFFKIQGLVSYNVSCSGIQREHVLGDLRVEAFVLVCGTHLQHRGAWGHVFRKADPVHVLAEHWGVIVGIHHQDSDLSGAASRRFPAV